MGREASGEKHSCNFPNPKPKLSARCQQRHGYDQRAPRHRRTQPGRLAPSIPQQLIPIKL